jgi:hypothetical protein
MHGRGRPGPAAAGSRRVTGFLGGATAVAALAFAPLAGPVPVAGAAALAPAGVVAAAIAAGEAQPSVHWVATADVKGVKTVIDSHAGRASGWQTVEETAGTASASLTIELVGGTAFMTGSAGGLYRQGLTEKAATAEAGIWVAVPPSSAIFASVAAGLTMKSAMQELEMAGKVTSVAPSRVGGHLDPGYKGKTKASAGQPSQSETVYLTPAPHLPAKVLSGGATTLFDQWGSAVSVTRPSGAVTVKASWLQHR